MKLLVTLTLLASTFVVDAGVSMHNPNYCYANDFVRPTVRMHSVRSSYEAIRRTAVDTDVSCELRVKLRNETYQMPYQLALHQDFGS